MAVMLTRTQIARIVGNDHEAIRAFEDLIKQATQSTPADVSAIALGAGSAAADAQSAISLASAMKDLAGLAATAPISAEVPSAGDVSPAGQIHVVTASIADLAPV